VPHANEIHLCGLASIDVVVVRLVRNSSALSTAPLNLPAGSEDNSALVLVSINDG